MKYNKVAVGGTFDHFHKGHKALLNRAFESGYKVIVGLTSDSYSVNKSQEYNIRKSSLEKYLKGKNYEIFKLEDPYGPAISDKEIDDIVVSSETKEKALEINFYRQNHGLDSLEIIVVPLVKADNGKRISSTGIRNGKITKEGKIL